VTSLTREQARTRASELAVRAMDVELDLDRGAATFRSTTTITLDAWRTTRTFFDVRPVTLLSMTLDGEALDPGQLADARYPLELEPGTHQVRVEADMAYSRDGEGLHRTVDPADGEAYLYLMSFLDAAPRCFACFDQPDLKAPYRMRVRVPQGWTVLGNTRATRAADGAWELAESLPLATYLVALVAGPYHSITREHDGILLGLHAKRSLAGALDREADELFTVTTQSFDAMHDRFGIRYPFGDYHQAFVPEFNAGAMESPGCVTFRDGLVFRSAVTDGERSERANVVVHEMAHQWFGNLVTPVWWDDLWLNESFAEYMGYRIGTEVTRFDDAWVDFAFIRKRWGLVADQRPSTHPVAGNGAADAHAALHDFDGISYAKGAAVLKQLAAHLGDDVFFAGVRDHLRAHAYGNATLADLLAAWERAGARHLGAWAKAWLSTTGADTLTVDGDELVRAASAGGGGGRPHSLTVSWLGAADSSGESHQVVVSGERTPLPRSPAGRSIDGKVLLLDVHDDTWAKLRLDDASLAGLVDVLPGVTDPVTRGAVWLSVRDAFDDAEVRPAWALKLLCAALAREDSDIAVGNLLSWGHHVLLGRVMGGDPAATDRLAGVAYARAMSAPPGSGLQLAAARGLIEVTRDTELLGSWLGSGGPEGLVVDTELRWHLRMQQCRRGAVGLDAVDAELEHDRSTEGQVHAARCRAALPDATAKAEAWRILTTDASASNYVLYAIGDGFWWPEQQLLTAPYVPRFFTELPATAELRQGWVVAGSTKAAFPRFAVDPSSLLLADRLIADDTVDRGVRRSVVDEADGVRRALRVRRRFLAS